MEMEMNSEIVNELQYMLDLCPSIPEETKYWLVRTEGGRLHDAFISSQSIAIGYPKLPLETVSNWIGLTKEKITNRVKRAYPDSKRPGLIASQITAFTSEMKRGDIVMSPSHSRSKISVGFINDDKPFEEEFLDEEDLAQKFTKRRSVKWFKTVNGSEINPNLLRVFNARQAIACADKYAAWIDTLLYDFFRKGNIYNLSLSIQSRDGIKAANLFKTYSVFLN